MLKIERDWTGNKRSNFANLGVGKDAIRDERDFYATPPRAVELLLDLEKFDKNIWECACGQGHISKVLERYGYNVYSTDLYDHGYGISGIDFLKSKEKWHGDIVTNPPFKYALQFVEQALDVLWEGKKAAFFLRIQFLEGKARRRLFEKAPPKRIWVSSSRIGCAINGRFGEHSSSAMTFCWFVWEKGFKGDTILKWFN